MKILQSLARGRLIPDCEPAPLPRTVGSGSGGPTPREKLGESPFRWLFPSFFHRFPSFSVRFSGSKTGCEVMAALSKALRDLKPGRVPARLHPQGQALDHRGPGASPGVRALNP